MSSIEQGSASGRPLRQGVVLALWLSLGAAVSLGITRFAYGLLLPPMRADLGWSYVLAGAMNTANAVGYLVGALTVPALMRRWGAMAVLLGGSALAALFMAGSGFFTADAPLLAQRWLAGITSAWVFVAGGLLAARLGSVWPRHAGLLLGLYYGGVGSGIVVSALAVPVLLAWAAQRPHAWAWAWWGLALVCLVATAGLAHVQRVLATLGLAGPAPAVPPSPPASGGPTSPGADRAHPTGALLRALAPALLGYLLFGVGYIGYMTFVIALLRERGTPAADITLFYALLGVAVVASSRLWAGLLDRHRDGQPLARLNALLGVATVLPALTHAWPMVLASGVLFGAVFLSVVASTTALVRHNLPAHRWAAGISAFTIVFAAGQIVGPTVVGWIGDAAGGLERGLLFSALALWLGAASAWRQRALA
ncbi:D-galactonate transporter [Tepidimonas thermarum]|uniref:D-galactonate transporter n=1 Tax=Tepidimonas thermarum TaxID=335431 RepID=A0A554X2R1_9BURK|nr:YbfB/YjiJ family MFS transporter [Tepidimonas thermarum]TSE30129.1 D-galactonate transporter [Tepidimonas thermarum]